MEGQRRRETEREELKKELTSYPYHIYTHIRDHSRAIKPYLNSPINMNDFRVN